MKKLLLSLSLVAFSATLFAQSGSLSPYAYYGLGALCERSNSASRGMNGVGQAFREGNQVNVLNPASYSSIDSLSFIFDMGMSLDRTWYDDGTNSTGKNTASFEYLIAGFRVWKHVGMSFGILPVSTINYNFSSSQTLTNYSQLPYDITQKITTATTTYDGDGGCREIYLGAGWEPFKHFSIGANVMYMWGSIDRWSYLRYSDDNVKTLEKNWGENISKVRFNVGLQYSLMLNRAKDRSLTVGATYTPGTTITSNALKYIINYSSAAADTTKYMATRGYQTPTEVAIGVAYRSGKKWRVGFDYDYQNWGSFEESKFICVDDITRYEGNMGSYRDRHKMTIGGEWCKNPNGHSYFDRIKFRAGFGYSTPYFDMYVQDIFGNSYYCKGPGELSATLGFALPIINGYTNRSVLNIGFQWVQESGSLIKENTFRVNIALTFNERWFAKWKFE